MNKYMLHIFLAVCILMTSVISVNADTGSPGYIPPLGPDFNNDGNDDRAEPADSESTEKSVDKDSDDGTGSVSDDSTSGTGKDDKSADTIVDPTDPHPLGPDFDGDGDDDRTSVDASKDVSGDTVPDGNSEDSVDDGVDSALDTTSSDVEQNVQDTDAVLDDNKGSESPDPTGPPPLGSDFDNDGDDDRISEEEGSDISTASDSEETDTITQRIIAEDINIVDIDVQQVSDNTLIEEDTTNSVQVLVGNDGENDVDTNNDNIFSPITTITMLFKNIFSYIGIG